MEIGSLQKILNIAECLRLPPPLPACCADFRSSTEISIITPPLRLFPESFSRSSRFVILISLARRFADGAIGIGDFTMYFTAVTTLTLKLSSIISTVGEYNMT